MTAGPEPPEGLSLSSLPPPTIRIPAGRRPGSPAGGTPLGVLVAQTSKVLDRAFDDALAFAGGSRPTWLILLAVKSGAGTRQSALADRVGISGPTLTHHLDKLEAAGLVRRNRDPNNRRAQSIELTAGGETMFVRLRDAAIAFDTRLRAGLDDDAVAAVVTILRQLSSNVRDTSAPARRGSGLPKEAMHDV